MTKRKGFFLFCKGKNASIIFLQETHSKVEYVLSWSKQWGDGAYFCHGTSRSAGVAVLLKNFQGQIISHIEDDRGHWQILILTLDELKCILINIYGYNETKENKKLFEQIGLYLDNLKLSHPTDNIIIGDDLNLVPDEFYDKYPSKYSASHPNTTFTNFFNEHSLVDAWRYLNPEIFQYSWFSSNHKSRIDHWLIASHLLCYEIGSDISAAPLTDQCCLFVLET